jgi:hypothetical protein
MVLDLNRTEKDILGSSQLIGAERGKISILPMPAPGIDNTPKKKFNSTVRQSSSICCFSDGSEADSLDGGREGAEGADGLGRSDEEQ